MYCIRENSLPPPPFLSLFCIIRSLHIQLPPLLQVLALTVKLSAPGSWKFCTHYLSSLPFIWPSPNPAFVYTYVSLSDDPHSSCIVSLSDDSFIHLVWPCHCNLLDFKMEVNSSALCGFRISLNIGYILWSCFCCCEIGNSSCASVTVDVKQIFIKKISPKDIWLFSLGEWKKKKKKLWLDSVRLT